MTRPVAVVTGAAGGIGKWIALGLAQAGQHTVLIGRDAARGAAARDFVARHAPDASTEFLRADLASLAETRALGAQLVAAHPRIAVLVANAGIFSERRCVTAEGHERVLAVNHLSPFVLIETLQPALMAAAPARIVTVGSSTSDRARIDPDNLELTRHWGMVRAYAQSKLALMMTTFEWARLLQPHGVTANVVHPGAVATGLVRAPGAIGLAWRLMAPWLRTEQQGAQTPLHVALSASCAGLTGQYFKNCAVARPNRLALDAALARRVFGETVRLVGG